MTTSRVRTGVFRVLLEIDIGDTAPADFFAVWRRMAETAARAPGILAQSLNADTRRDGRYFVVSEWRTTEDFTAFSAGADHERLATSLKALGRTVSMTGMTQVLTSPPVSAVSEVRP
ncbi:antibiotic biosynthesis monooxygenase [Amycolatopsis sp. QT-25]|uniref:antibiotic biosynthesis monooxygenase family protein n=1 Tax=Amycolatopsis sp. QT-25 TaxID=3034022 RepID=UPI0023EC1DF3|nr:antibiotic biosynthesis monooxygenase [Amycolatopsis sp. QT-25]WET76813.1 antibiotic biosynthesis monooxygenase [Amycolatopsis sp. QT-25]